MWTKESVYIRKEFNSHKSGLEHQHGRRFIGFIVLLFLFLFFMASVRSYENALYKTNYHTIQYNSICHLRVPKNLTFKTRLSAKLLLWKWVLFASQSKIIFISMASHLASLWKWDFLELGNGLFNTVKYNAIRNTALQCNVIQYNTKHQSKAQDKTR